MSSGPAASRDLPAHTLTTVQQTAPPVEYTPESVPVVSYPASTVVSFSLDECLPALEQSARVEPSPERFYTLSSCAEEDETPSPSSAASGQCIAYRIF